MAELLDRDTILAADDLDYRDVDVPQWGTAPVRLRSLSLADYEQFQRECKKCKKGDADAVMLLTLSWCIIDKEGKRIFAAPAELRSRSAFVLLRLMEVAGELNSPDEAQAEKNSPSGQDGGSPSASHENSAA